MFSKKKILLVDDDENLTMILALLLEAKGNYDVRIENKSTQALRAALEYQPDIILLDVIMPRKGGQLVAAEMKSKDELKDIPIIFLTAIITKEEEHSNNSIIEGHTFIAKPSSIDHILEVIKIGLIHHRPSQEQDDSIQYNLN